MLRAYSTNTNNEPSFKNEQFFIGHPTNSKAKGFIFEKEVS
jgi:hypothetical protein